MTRWADIKSGRVDLGYCECGCGGRTKIAPYSRARAGWVKGQPIRFIQGHSGNPQSPDPASYIADNTVPGPNGCRLWTGPLTPDGYGRSGLGGRKRQAHRVVYEFEVGPIPDGLHIDHLCRVRRCVNPAHLEPVTLAENNRRAAAEVTHCPQGHAYTADNVLISNGRRNCKACRNARNRLARGGSLTDAMTDLLWTAAQMKHGWAWVSRHRGQRQVADALVRRGLVKWCEDKGREHHQPRIWITDAGKDVVARRWPVSPFLLGTYAHQPEGWTPREGVAT